MDTAHIRRQRGFTLVEVMVALAILTLGLLGVATMISRSTIQDARAYYLTQASMIVEEALENATRAQYDEIAFNNMIATSGNRTIDGVTYVLNCTLMNNTPINNCNEMTCVVTWNNKGIPGSTQNVYVYSKKYRLQ